MAAAYSFCHSRGLLGSLTPLFPKGEESRIWDHTAVRVASQYCGKQSEKDDIDMRRATRILPLFVDSSFGKLVLHVLSADAIGPES
jgi:hypothetical protein